MNIVIKFALFLIIICPLLVWAEDQRSKKSLELSELTNLNFEELTQVKISVTSKKGLSSLDSPGLVTVYTAAEIKALGYYTLAELANITPGFTSMYKFAGKQSYTVRGFRVPGDNFDNNKVLVLIDGIPVNNLRNLRAPMNEEVALDGIERVEFLRGPASALYGTGAFFGVINLVSKKKRNDGATVEGRTTLGAYGTLQNNVSGYFRNEAIEGNAIATYSRKDSMALPWGDNSADYRRSVDHLEAMSVNSSIKLREGIARDFTIGLLHNGIKSGTWDNGSDPAPTTEADTGYYYFSTSIAYLKYQKQISERFYLNSFLKQAISSEESRSYNYRQNFSGTEALVEGHYDFNKESKLIMGLNFDTRKRVGRNHGTFQNTGNVNQDNYVKSESEPLRTYSGYAQYNTRFPVGYGLLATFGLRYDRATSDEGQISIDVSQLSPRVALVQKLRKDLALKFLYGRALKSPTLKDIGVANEAYNSVSNPEIPTSFTSLTAEKISSYELGLTFEKEKISSTLAIFYMVTQDQIGREIVDITPSDPTSGEESLYRNETGNAVAYGASYEFKYATNQNNLWNFNFAWNKAYLPDNDIYKKGSFGGVPAYTSSLTYIKKWDQFFGSFVGYYIGPRRLDKNAEDAINGFLMLDANVGYALNKSADFTLWMRNLSNRDFRYSATGAQDTLSERGPGRSFFGTFNYRF